MPRPKTFEELGALVRLREERGRAAAALSNDALAMRREHDRILAEALAQAAQHAGTPFEPDPALRSQIIQDICSDSTLAEIADKAHTSMEQLSLWMARPEIQRRIQAVTHAMTVKVGIRLLNQSEVMLGSLGRIISHFHEYESAHACLTGTDQDKRATLRNRESVMRAIALMLRTHRDLGPRQPRRNHPAAPRARGPRVVGHALGLNAPVLSDDDQPPASHAASPRVSPPPGPPSPSPAPSVAQRDASLHDADRIPKLSRATPPPNVPIAEVGCDLVHGTPEALHAGTLHPVREDPGSSVPP